MIKIGASFGGNSFNAPFKVIDANDTIVTERYYGNITSSSFLRIGIEHQIKTSMFYYGIDLLFGYHSNERYSANKTTTLDIDGNWNPQTYHGSSYFEDRAYATIKEHYFV